MERERNAAKVKLEWLISVLIDATRLHKLYCCCYALLINSKSSSYLKDISCELGIWSIRPWVSVWLILCHLWHSLFLVVVQFPSFMFFIYLTNILLKCYIHFIISELYRQFYFSETLQCSIFGIFYHLILLSSSA